ncbi:transposase [Flavobacterium sp. LB1P62]|uniref:transposase n=1 Tax=unclassified Flavobacterium TaxID=196869 RepID=UPI003AAF4B2C
MPLFKNKYQTESNRLKNWDYSSEAIYFITLVTQNRKCIFGTIDDDNMVLNDNGKMIETELLRSIAIRERWFFHNWVIMPNHIHLLIEIVSSSVETHDVETHCGASLRSKSGPPKLSRKPNSISSFVAIFKLVTTKQINILIDNYGTQCRDAQCRDALQCVSTKEPEQPIINTIWQTNYHDHIVRNYNSFDTIYHYIKNNPKNWNTDSINSNLE